MAPVTDKQIDKALIRHLRNISDYIQANGIEENTQRNSIITLAEAWDALTPDGLMDDVLLNKLLARKALWIEDAPLPKPTEKVTYDSSFVGQICRYMENKGYRIDKGEGEVNIVYVEGCNADGTLNDDAPNQFNDRRIVFTFKDGYPKIIGNWEATTEPGYYYTDNPMNVAGAARIKFGQYIGCWEVGIHGNSAPHEALVQVRPVTVFRDYNRDMARVGDKEETGNFGINQHGGYNYPWGNIGPASAGCQVGRTMEGHEEFMSIIKSDPRYKKDKGFAFSASIIPGTEVIKK